MNKAEEATSELIKTSSNAAKLLEFEEESLNQMPLLVKPPVAEPRIRVVFLGRDAKISLAICNEFPELPFPIGFVG